MALPDLQSLLRQAADFIEGGSEFEGQCCDCGMDPWSGDYNGQPKDHHEESCIVRQLRAAAEDVLDESTASRQADADAAYDDEPLDIETARRRP